MTTTHKDFWLITLDAAGNKKTCDYSEGMYEVRVPGGVACVSASELVSL